MVTNLTETKNMYHFSKWIINVQVYIDELMQERRNSIANALELHLSCSNPSNCYLVGVSHVHSDDVKLFMWH